MIYKIIPTRRIKGAKNIAHDICKEIYNARLVTGSRVSHALHTKYRHVTSYWSGVVNDQVFLNAFLRAFLSNR